MTTKNPYAGIEHVEYLSTDLGRSCSQCSKFLSADNFQENVNHLIEKHGYKLLHVGSESSHSDAGIWNATVAVLGL